jgi:glycine/D-amino acid oxidase-like deaminating enzyme
LSDPRLAIGFGIPLWQATAPEVAPGPCPTGEMTVDLAVIGGGFTGLSTALHAAQAGLSVALLEARAIAWGASGRNAGFVVPNFAKADPDTVLARLGEARGERLLGFAAASADLVFDLIARNKIACNAAQSGWIQPAHADAALSRLKARAEQWRRRGRPVEVLGPDAVAEATGISGYAGGQIDRSGGVLDPLAYARGLADSASRAGARLFESTRVTRIDQDPAGWRASTTNCSVRARRMVIACNAYIDGLAPAVNSSLIPLRVFQIATEPVPSATRARFLQGAGCLSDTRRNLFTVRFDADGRLISGGMDILPAGAERRVPKAIHARLARMLGLEIPPIGHAWSGLAAVTPDFLPKLYGLGDGLLAATACNGRGIALSTAAGRCLADWAAGTPLDALPIPSGPPAPLSWHRIARYAPNALLPLSMLRDRIETLKHRARRGKSPT